METGKGNIKNGAEKVERKTLKRSQLFTPKELVESYDLSYSAQEIGTLLKLELLEGVKIGHTTLINPHSIDRVLNLREKNRKLSIDFD
jgi:hypothetical protein